MRYTRSISGEYADIARAIKGVTGADFITAYVASITTHLIGRRLNMDNQKTRILNHLNRYHKIDPLKAWSKYGVYRLSDVIYKLRKDGYEIETADKVVKNKYGEKCRVAEYIL